MLPDADGPERTFHVVIGTPDLDHCPICQAHAKAKVDQVMAGDLGPIQIQELQLHEILRCPCPMCAQARQEELGDEG